MSYQGPIGHVFLYHAYALALGGWVRDQQKRFTPIESIAPSVLSITGGFGSASERSRNLSVRGSYPFGSGGPNEFFVYVGHAYTEVRGVETYEENPYGTYKTTVRSILNDVRINDVFSVEHAEAILTSTHDKPALYGPSDEARITIGNSNISGATVAGKPVTLTPHGNIDKVPSFGMLRSQVKDYFAPPTAESMDSRTADPWLDEICDWHDPAKVLDGLPRYAYDLAVMNQKADSHLRYSLYKSAEIPTTPGARSFKSSIEVDDFGRIFFGEIFASHGTKQLSMFRLDLGCDNCGGVGGSSGSTNGSTYPP